MDGLKTGYTKGAGYCLTATIEKNGMRVIATVMGESDSNTRNSEVSSMLDYAFAQVSLKKVLSKNDVIKKINLPLSKVEEIKIVPKEDVNILYKKIEGKVNPTYDIEMYDIKLPVRVGEVVGKLYLKNNNKVIQKIDLTVKEKAEKCNLFDLYSKYLKSIISGNIKFM